MSCLHIQHLKAQILRNRGNSVSVNITFYPRRLQSLSHR